MGILYRNPNPDMFSEDEAKSILGRAARLDVADGTSFSAADLHRIAAGANISSTALDAALREARQARETSAARRWGERIRAVALVAAGVGLGVLTSVMDRLSLGQESAAAVFGPSAAVVLTLALKHRWRGNLKEFVQEAFVVLGVFALSVVVIEGFHALPIMLSWSSLCGVIGGFIVGIDFHSDRKTAVRDSAAHSEHPYGQGLP